LRRKMRIISNGQYLKARHPELVSGSIVIL
jgi:hypothetical protein